MKVEPLTTLYGFLPSLSQPEGVAAAHFRPRTKHLTM